MEDGPLTTCSNCSFSYFQFSITVVITFICTLALVAHRNRDGKVDDAKKNPRPSARASKRQSRRRDAFHELKQSLSSSISKAMSVQDSFTKALTVQGAYNSMIFQGGTEVSGAFLSSIISQLWHHMNIAVSNCIKETLDPLLSSLTVPLHFVKLDLGDVPIRTENMFIHPRAPTAVEAGEVDDFCSGVQIDLDVLWDGNPDVMLQATSHVTFGIQRIKLSGRMHILLSPLTTELPVVTAVQYGFTNPPSIELEFSGFAKSIAKQFAFVKPAIMSTVQSSLSQKLVLPYRMIFPIDLMSYDYLDTYQPPTGMIRISVENGRGFKVLKKTWGTDIPDLYCLVSLGGSSSFRTTTQWNNVTPSWPDETSDFILYDLEQKVYVAVMDDGVSPLDSGEEMGRVEISARHLFRGDNDGTVELELALNDNVHTGCFVTISAELFTLSDQLYSLSSPKYEGPHHVCGLIAVIVTRAFDIPLDKEDASTYVKVVSGDKTFFTPVITPDFPDNLDPVYSSAFHIPLTMEMMKEYDKDAEEELNDPSSRKQKRRSSSIMKKSVLKSKDMVEKGVQKSVHIMEKGVQKSVNIVEKGIPWHRSNSDSNNVVFTLMNDNTSNNNAPSKLGSFTVTYESLLRARNHTITEVRSIGEDGQRLGFRVVLSGIQSGEEMSHQSEEDRIQPQGQCQSGLEGSMPSHDPFAQSMIEQHIRVTALKGRGFTMNVRNLIIGTATDIKDIYCCIRLLRCSEQQQDQSDSTCWRTSTINDDTMPQWNESETFITTDPMGDAIKVDAYNENLAIHDEYLGSAEYPLDKLLRKRSAELELKMEGKSTGSFVTLKCVAVSAESESDLSSIQEGLGSPDEHGVPPGRSSRNNILRRRKKTLSLPKNTKKALRRLKTR